MTQKIICDNLANYLELINATTTQALCKQLRKHGFCHGFVTSYSNHKKPENKARWRAKLAAVAHWRGDINGLRKMIVLPGDDRTPVSLQKIFAEVLNSIVSKQGDKDIAPDFFPTGNYDQTEFLKFHDDVLEENTIKKFVALKSVSGNFNLHEMSELLKEEIFSHDYLSVSNIEHIIGIGKEENIYWIYNPNFDHRNEETMCKMYPSRENFIEGIQSCLENMPVTFLAGSWQAKGVPCFSNINKLMKENIELIASDGGLALMAYDSPKQLLTTFMMLAKRQGGLQLIAEKLIEQNEVDNHCYPTFFAIVNDHNAEALRYLFHLAKISSEIEEAMAYCFLPKTDDEEVILFTFIRKNSQLLSQLFHLVEQSSAIQKAIYASMEKEQDGWSFLHYLIHYAPDFLPQFLSLIKTSSEASQIIANAFFKRNEYDNTCLHLLLAHPKLYVKKLAEEFLTCIANTKNGYQIIQQGLKIKNNYRISAECMLKTHLPQLVSHAKRLSQPPLSFQTNSASLFKNKRKRDHTSPLPLSNKRHKNQPPL